MLKRLVLGLLLGLIVGGLVAAGVVRGLGMVTFGDAPALAYLLAAATGTLTGLIAGKPIWSADGKIEAGLKAFFGALLAAGAMFALRKWGDFNVDLTALAAGAGRVGDLPAAALPLVAGLLGGIFELDNTDPPPADEKGAKTRVAPAKSNVRVASVDEGELDDVPVVDAKKKR